MDVLVICVCLKSAGLGLRQSVLPGKELGPLLGGSKVCKAKAHHPLKGGCVFQDTRPVAQEEAWLFPWTPSLSS